MADRNRTGKEVFSHHLNLHSTHVTRTSLLNPQDGPCVNVLVKLNMNKIEGRSRHERRLVLLHGMGTGAGGWQPQVEEFSQRFQVLAPHLPGWGGTPGPFSLQGAVESVAEMLEAEDGPPAFVCGLSLGALVALELARSRAELVDRLVLCGGFVSLPSEMLAPRQAAAETIRGLDAATFSQQVSASLVSEVPEAYRQLALREIGALTAADVADVIYMDFDASSWIGALKMPSLVLCGDRDEVNVPLSRELADRLPNADFREVPGAGHVANLDAPVAFNELLGRFLA